MIMQYRAKTKQDKVYLRGLLKNEVDIIPEGFLKWWVEYVYYPDNYVDTDIFLKWINASKSLFKQEWIDWLYRQGIIEVEPVEKSVMFYNCISYPNSKFNSGNNEINPDKFEIKFYRPIDPGDVHVFFYIIGTKEYAFIVKLDNDVLEKLNKYNIRIRNH